MFATLSSLNEKPNGRDVFCVFSCLRASASENEESGLNYNFDMIHTSICSYMFIIILVDENIER